MAGLVELATDRRGPGVELSRRVTVRRVHADFFAVCATLAPIMLVGSVLAMRPWAGRRPSLLLTVFTTATQSGCAILVILLSLLILSGMVQETANWIGIVLGLTVGQAAVGLTATALQTYRGHS